MPEPLIAAVDLGASRLRAALATRDGDLRERDDSAVPLDDAGRPSPDVVVAGVVAMLEALLGRAGQGAPAALGIGLPGIVKPGRGTVGSPANLPGWKDVDLAAMLRRRWDVPVAVENDANMAALGEGWRGSAAGLASFLFVALGTGIGAGLVVDGRLWRGAHLFAGEMAYTVLDRATLPADPSATWLEDRVAGRGIAAVAAQRLGRRLPAREVFDLAARGDGAAEGVVRQALELLAMAVANVCALLDPEAVVFGGGMSRRGELLLAPVRDIVRRVLPSPPHLLLSSLGEDAQLYGAVRAAQLAAGAG